MGSDKRYEGTFTNGGLIGKVFLKKADVKARLDTLYGDGPLPKLDSQWGEIGTWHGCKLVAKKSGAVVRYAHQHDGTNRCCQVAQLTLQGHATYGVSKASMPIWMRASLDGYWVKGWYPGKVVSWTRKNDHTAVTVVESSVSGIRYEITLERGRTDGSNAVREHRAVTATSAIFEDFLAGIGLR